MWSKRASELEDIPRFCPPKWGTYSSGCHEAPTDFGGLNVINSSSERNISIVAMVNFGINAS